ncbi:MAG: 1-acyl-sn-glycerol-3-phosphate acyltransferase [Anaerolineaceae bacterium]|nr:1-acyl-sn-glycerol-3-phosphate acyltransferase [Anaerolineaceae bacterium]
MRAAFVNLLIRFLLLFLCKIDYSNLDRIQKQGPVILIGNHINFLDAPLVFSRLWPRKFVIIVKLETFENPIFKFLFNTWGGISIKRGTADFGAYKLALEALKQGKILCIAPEGTRTNDAKLIQGNPGIIAIAQKSGVPIIPVVSYGAEEFHDNYKKLIRTKIFFEVGKPFVLNLNSNYPDKAKRKAITDEIMYQMAIILPEKYRGYYSDLSKLSTNYLKFIDPA